ncbi:hypothetical protein C5167_006203 [Papaver somniferum]|uniref:Uncharacterized protein n=1 Tax=Papaver somniferum TaxID=3469 RepID=A0A4Y7JFW2_PAPSO|nr:hypothetical protein C5167_006203 [Papaver somniferum]
MWSLQLQDGGVDEIMRDFDEPGSLAPTCPGEVWPHHSVGNQLLRFYNGTRLLSVGSVHHLGGKFAGNEGEAGDVADHGGYIEAHNPSLIKCTVHMIVESLKYRLQTRY